MNTFGFILYTLFIIAITCIIFYFILKGKKTEQVNHPAHYKKNGKECIDVMIEKFGVQAVYHFCICNEFKYQWRAGNKKDNSEEQDLKKAKWYKDYADKLAAEHIEKIIDYH